MKIDKEQKRLLKNIHILELRNGYDFKVPVDVNRELDYIKLMIQKYKAELLLISFFQYQRRKGKKSNEIFSYEYELLHGFLLIYGQRSIKEISFNKLKNDIPTKKELKRLFKCLELFFTSFFMEENDKSFLESPSLFENTKEPKSVLRLRTNAVRRIGNGRQHIDYIKEIASGLDAKYKKNHGFLLTDFIEGFITLIGYKSYDNKREKNILLSHNKIHNNIRTFYGLEVNSNKSLTLSRLLLCPPKIILKFYILNTIAENYMFYTLEDLCNVFNVDAKHKGDLLKIINKISIHFGEMKELNDKDLHLENPIWTNPFICLHDELYIYPNPEIPLTSIEEIVLNILDTNEKKEFNDYKTKKFLEQKVYNLLSEKFGNQNLSLGTKWKSDINNQQFENDILLIYGENAFVIEIKGNNLTNEGRKGLPNRTNKKVGEIIEKASQQANHFIEHLKKFKGKKAKLKSPNGKNIFVDLTNVTNFISIGISFEWMIFMSLGLRELRRNFNIPKGHIHMCLNELSMVLDILETPNDIAYYFFQRSRLEKADIFIKGDESDLIIHYIKKRFDFSKYAIYYNSFDITGRFFELSSPSYFELKYLLANEKNSSYEVLQKFEEYKDKVDKPKIKRTAFWNDIIDQLNRKSILKNKLNIFGAILAVNYQNQKSIKKRLYYRVKSNKKEPFFVVKNDFLNPDIYVYAIKANQLENPMEIIYNDKLFDHRIINNGFGIILVFKIFNNQPILYGLALPKETVMNEIFNLQ